MVQKKKKVVIAVLGKESLMGRVQWHTVKVLSMILDMEYKTVHIHLCTSLAIPITT